MEEGKKEQVKRKKVEVFKVGLSYWRPLCSFQKMGRKSRGGFD